MNDWINTPGHSTNSFNSSKSYNGWYTIGVTDAHVSNGHPYLHVDTYWKKSDEYGNTFGNSLTQNHGIGLGNLNPWT